MNDLSDSCRLVIDLNSNGVDIRVDFNLSSVDIESLATQLVFIGNGALSGKIEDAILAWCNENDAQEFFDVLVNTIGIVNKQIKAAIRSNKPLISPNLNDHNEFISEES